MDFDERQLRGFIAVAETGSLGRASRIVNLTQPSLSRQVLAMEQRLGHRLFERGTKGMVPTEAGQTLLRHARHLVGEMQSTRDELAALGGLRRGTVRVGAVAAVLRTLVADTVGRVLAETPLLTFDLVDAVDDQLRADLVDRRIDLAVTSRPLEDRDVLAIGTCAYSDSFAVFCAANHSLPPEASLAEALAYAWVMPSRNFTPRSQFEDIVARHTTLQPHVAAQCTSVEMMIAISARSDLLCWLPTPLLAPYLANGTMRMLSIPELELHRRFVLHRRRSGILSDAAHQFVRHFPLLPRDD